MTEFAGVHVRQALSFYLDALRTAQRPAPKVPKVVPSEPVAAEGASPTEETSVEPVNSEIPAEAPAAEAGTPAEVPVVAEAAPADPVPAAPAEVLVSTGDPAIKKRVAPQQLSTEAAEEAKKKIAETLKIEGDRLNLLWEAVQAVDRRKPKELLRRIVVLVLSETEKAPAGAVKRGEHVFVTEYLPESISGRRGRPGREGRDGRPGRGGRGGRPGKGGKGGRGPGREAGGRGRPGGRPERDGAPSDRPRGDHGRRPGGERRPPAAATGRPTPTPPGSPKIVIKPVSKPNPST